MQPDISVVLCIYNGETFLRQAIDSVLCQSITHFELLLIDDGSTDNTLSIIRQFEKRDSRCVVLTGPNQGLIGSRNMGIEHAQAEYIALMDADDICMPQRLSTQLQYLQANPVCVAVGSQVLFIDPDARPIKPFLTEATHQAIDAAHMAGRGGAIINPSAMIRKSAFMQVGMYQKDFLHAEDMDMFLRLAEVGELANIPEILLHYRQHPASVGYQHASTQQASAARATEAARQRRGLHKESDHLNSMHTAERTSLVDIYTKWAWWALDAGNIGTARHHGFRALRMRPFRISNFRLFFCLLRGH
jgi:glycosyltransferase involved in cell wall biosynthesis